MYIYNLGNVSPLRAREKERERERERKSAGTRSLQEIIINNHKPKSFLNLVEHSHKDLAWFKKSKKNIDLNIYKRDI